MKKLFLLSILISIYFSNTYADNSYFIDFSKVLNNSKAGAQAQKKLKDRILSETKKFKKKEDDIRKQENEIYEFPADAMIIQEEMAEMKN